MSDSVKSSASEYVSVNEAAKRLTCSVRTIERIMASNDGKKIGLIKVGRKMNRLNWLTFQRALESGTLRS